MRPCESVSLSETLQASTVKFRASQTNCIDLSEEKCRACEMTADCITRPESHRFCPTSGCCMHYRSVQAVIDRTYLPTQGSICLSFSTLLITENARPREPLQNDCSVYHAVILEKKKEPAHGRASLNILSFNLADHVLLPSIATVGIYTK